MKNQSVPAVAMVTVCLQRCRASRDHLLTFRNVLKKQAHRQKLLFVDQRSAAELRSLEGNLQQSLSTCCVFTFLDQKEKSEDPHLHVRHFRFIKINEEQTENMSVDVLQQRNREISVKATARRTRAASGWTEFLRHPSEKPHQNLLITERLSAAEAQSDD